MRGWAIEIKLLGWAKRSGEGTAFETLLSHYVGSFSKTQARAAYKRLDGILDDHARKRKTSPYKSRRGNRR